LYLSKFQVTIIEEVRKKWETSSYHLLTYYWLDVHSIYYCNLLTIVFLMCFPLVLIFSFLHKKGYRISEWRWLPPKRKNKELYMSTQTKQILSFMHVCLSIYTTMQIDVHTLHLWRDPLLVWLYAMRCFTRGTKTQPTYLMVYEIIFGAMLVSQRKNNELSLTFSSI
jgi:hypothetical protein